MQALMWRLVMGVLALAEFVWLAVTVPAVWISQRLCRWSDLAQIEWLAARHNVRGRRR